MENKINSAATRKPTTKRYDDAFKAGAVRLVVENKRPLAQVSRELGVTSESLRAWVKAADNSPQSEYSQTKALQAEIKALKKELEDKEETIEILKKAAAIFTRK